MRPISRLAGLVLWLAVVGTAVLLGATHWPRSHREHARPRADARQSSLLWLLFPVLKLLHEFGHAYAVKAFGGEVHEMGVMILVLTPVPYVDASAAGPFARNGSA